LVKRRPGELLPLEEHLLTIGSNAVTQADPSHPAEGWFHAYGAAKALAEGYGDSLAKNGTLYRSLRGLADRKLLTDRLETEAEAATHTGPARRYFKITALGEVALAETRALREAVNKASVPSKRTPVPTPTSAPTTT
jgi:hypothetical protein